MTRSSVPRSLATAVGFLTILAVSACSTTRVAPGGAAAVAPQLTVERFLQAANDRDLEAMSRLFGTVEGPIGDTGSTFGCFWKKIGSWFGGTSCVDRSQVEIRLDAIARVLQYRDYRIDGEENVAGRRAPTRRVFVNLTLNGGNRVDAVPFEVVQGAEQRWYVERLDLERIMQGGGV
jgi:hypothetical protein